ncbi:carbohydrate kinase [Qingshengfaniella alkalisoli]|uniref:Carbohydrate kinase n=2 Tax=Qingshengfaniella alkalisoli TaxID=2599296 RepID=A0A5B8IVY5_9RHOB|nr:carbohydrate kinase [Qingshengfaniella alkalisoli]
MLPRQTADGDAAFLPCTGGAVFNTAIAASRLGCPTALFTGLSRDLFGAKLMQALQDSGVATGYAQISDRPTTLAFVELVDGHARYAFYDEATATRMITSQHLPDLESTVTALFFGGISLVVEPCGTAFEALAQREANSKLIMLDPNIRPSFIQDEAAYRARLDRMLAVSDIVKLSDEDLHWLRGSGDLETLAADLLKQGPRFVCITEGAKGARVFAGDFTVRESAVPVQVADTVGAGDTFNAGLLAGLEQPGRLNKDALSSLGEDDIRHALSLAMRSAAITVSRVGANPPLLSEIA